MQANFIAVCTAPETLWVEKETPPARPQTVQSFYNNLTATQSDHVDAAVAETGKGLVWK